MPPDRTPWTRRAALAVAAFALLTGLTAWLASGHMPGTLRFDKTGAAHGSGWKIYRYPGGAPKVEERYDAGELAHSRWLRPDGSVVDETAWRGGTGTGYELRDDGSVSAVYAYEGGVAVAASYYDAAGNWSARRRRLARGFQSSRERRPGYWGGPAWCSIGSGTNSDGDPHARADDVPAAPRPAGPAPGRPRLRGRARHRADAARAVD